MAHQTIPPLGALDPTGFANARTPLSEIGRHSQNEEAAFSALESGQSHKCAGTSVADLALDLVLNEIVQQVRFATNATGATIQLVSGNELVCRAAAGATAQEASAHLAKCSEILGTCTRTGKVQRCDDVDTDTRVDASACRRLGLQSILVAPVRNDEEGTRGVILVFSARSRSFSDRDALTLQAFSRRVLLNINLTGRIIPKGPALAFSVPTGDRLQPNLLKFDSGRRVGPRASRFSGGLRMMFILAALTAALCCGWMLRGRVNRVTAVGPAKVEVPLPSRSAANSGNLTGPPAAVIDPAPAATMPISSASKPTLKTPDRAVKVAPARTSMTRNSAQPGTHDDLVVYENNRLGEIGSSAKSPSSTSKPASNKSVQAGSIKSDVPSSPLLVSEEIATSRLVHRVEPQYPKSAIENHIQGQVVLVVEVNREGAVHGVHVLSGNPLLASVAADAVRLWRFQTYLRNGQPTDFESHITLNFALP